MIRVFIVTSLRISFYIMINKISNCAIDETEIFSKKKLTGLNIVL